MSDIGATALHFGGGAAICRSSIRSRQGNVDSPAANSKLFLVARHGVRARYFRGVYRQGGDQSATARLPVGPAAVLPGTPAKCINTTAPPTHWLNTRGSIFGLARARSIELSMRMPVLLSPSPSISP